MRQIILASQSPRRQQLLQWAEVQFEVIVRHTDEDFPAELPIEEVPVHIAHQKALSVANYLKGTESHRYDDALILAADTVVVLGNEIIGKPAHRQDAIEILMKLSAQQHRVITGVCLMQAQQRIEFHDITTVTFHELDRQQVEHYVDKYKPYDKAGAYAIQEWIGVTGIKSINGDFYNVMGLPVSRVVKALKETFNHS